MGRNLESKAKYHSPQELEAIISASKTKTFKGNPTLRDSNSSILRPLKQISLKVFDDEVGIIRTFLAFQTASFLKGSLKNPASKMALGQARQVISLMKPTEIKHANAHLQKINLPRNLAGLLKGSPGMKSWMKTEVNFALMGVISSMIAMGIYDGLDLQTTKDSVMALDPLQLNRTFLQYAVPGMISRSAYRNAAGFFNNRFEIFYDKMLTTKGFGAAVLKRWDQSMAKLGNSLSAASRKGIDGSAGPSLTKRLGLVGIGQGTALTLKGLLRSVSTGIAFGTVGSIVVDSIFIGASGYADTAVIGGNRNFHSNLPEYNTFLYQRTGNQFQDWINARRFALYDYWDDKGKYPLTHFFGKASGFVDAYAGSVAAGALLVGGGLPGAVGGVMVSALFGGLGQFMGRWVTRKFERSVMMREMRTGLVEKRLFKALQKMDITSRLSWDESKLREIFRLRALDMLKRVRSGHTFNRMYLVETFSKVNLYR